MISGWVRIVGATGIAALLLAVGVAAGVFWQSQRDDDAHRTTPSVTDVGFAQDMSTHHDQAILMANSLPADVGPEIRGLADRMVAAQTAEVATLRGWLTWFSEPVTADHPMGWMAGHTSGHPGHTDGSSASDQPPMPGLASTDELTRLAGSHGRDAEILFLQLMIRHHRGGMTMATAAFNDPRASSATKHMALTMLGEQGDEVGQMSLLLRARDAAPLPT